MRTAKPLRDYCLGLMMPCERKSVEPMAAITAPERTAAQHQSLLHFIGEGRWSDEKVLAKVRELVLPQLERHGPVEAWIIDDTSFPKKGQHSVGVARQYCGELGKQDNSDRMLPFLGKARVIDDPRFDRAVAFQLRQHQFPHLRENLLVRPSSVADKMQQRLMLGCGPLWRCDRCHRLHAFALARHHQTQAIIAKRLGPVRMPDHARKPRHIGRKSRLTLV